VCICFPFLYIFFFVSCALFRFRCTFTVRSCCCCSLSPSIPLFWTRTPRTSCQPTMALHLLRSSGSTFICLRWKKSKIEEGGWPSYPANGYFFSTPPYALSPRPPPLVLLPLTVESGCWQTVVVSALLIQLCLP